MANENKRDYYEVLGLKKDATDADIKRAYRKLAAQYHPDVNHDPGAEEKFKEINEANEVLSDPDKRTRYDQYGFAGVDPNFNPNAGGSPFGGAGFGDFGDLGDIFGSFFGGGGRSTRRSASAPMQGDDIGARVELTFEEAAFGAEKEVTVSRVEDCDQCHGSGAAPGTGSVRTQQNFMGMTMQSTAACPDCRGTGRIIRTPCSRCKGKGKVRRSHKLMVKFPAGIDDGQALNLRGKGNAGLDGGPAGDLLITVFVKPHPLFERDGNSVLMEMPVSFAQAALGAEIEVPTIDGRVKLTIPEGTQPGSVFRLRGKGIPYLQSKGGGRGDQFVTITVTVPKNMTSEQKERLRAYAEAMNESVSEGRSGIFGSKKKR